MIRATLVAAFVALLPIGANAQSTTTVYAGIHYPLNGTPANTQEIGHAAGIASDGAGGFYFSSCQQHRVYRVGADGILTIVAGDGQGGDGGPAASAALRCPSGLARDAAGNVYIADRDDNRVRKVASGVISTVAGTGVSGFSGDGGPAISAQIGYPEAIAVDTSGKIYISDNLYRVRRIAADGTITTVAGTGVRGSSPDGGAAVSSALTWVGSLAVDSGGNLLIGMQGALRKVGVDGKIATIADGLESGGRVFGQLLGIAIDAAGNVIVSDSCSALDAAQNSLIRMISPAGVVTTVAGSGNHFQFTGDGGPATAATLYNPQGIALDTAGNLLIADWGNRRIRKVVNGIINTVAGWGPAGIGPPGGFSGDGGPATFAELSYPSGMAMDAGGNLFIADSGNHRIRRVSSVGTISTVAGSGVSGSGGDGGPATAAMLNSPMGVAVDRSGNLFIKDRNGIRKVTPDGKIATVLSMPFLGFWFGFAIDGSGNLFTVHQSGYQILKITPQGVISTFAGTTQGFSGDGGPALLAKFTGITALAADSHGNLFVGEYGRVRRIDAQGIITTVAGNGTTDFGRGDGGSATATGLDIVSGVAVDEAGNLFIATNFRIRMVSPDGIISTVEHALVEGSDFPHFDGLALDGNGNLYISDYEDHRVRLVTFQHSAPTLSEIKPNVVAPGTQVTVTLTGTGFYKPLTLDLGAGITLQDPQRAGLSAIVATVIVATDAVLGVHPVTVTTPFGQSNPVSLMIVPAFPDLEVTSTRDALRPGFETTYTFHVRNVGSAPSGSITLTDSLPAGFAFVSGTGSNWSCAAAGQTVNCANATPLAAGDSTDVSVKVVVGGDASSAAHSVTVSTAGDPIQNNNTLSEPIQFPTLPRPTFVLNPANPAPGKQATFGVSLLAPYPFDLTGVVTLNFVSNSIVPGDDPAIQFATGGRTVSFTIPANTFQARFNGGLITTLPLQTGTVAGSATLSGVLQSGAAQMDFSATIVIPRQPPTVQSVRAVTGAGFGPLVTFTSTPREITEVVLQFDTTPAVRLSCGLASGCSVSGSTLTLDVRRLFDAWYILNPGFGSVSTIYVPLSIQGQVGGKVWLTLRNSYGASIPVAFPLP